MRERHVDFGGVEVAGMRVKRVVHRPHEDRVHLRAPGGDGLRLRFGAGEVPDALAGQVVDSIQEVERAIRIYAGGALAARPRQYLWRWDPWPAGELWAFEFEAEVRESVRGLLSSLAPADWGLPRERVLVAPPGPFEDWEVLAVPADGGLEAYAQVWELWRDELRLSPYDAVLRIGADGTGTVLEVDVR